VAPIRRTRSLLHERTAIRFEENERSIRQTCSPRYGIPGGVARRAIQKSKPIKLYDRTTEQVSLDEIERIAI
jgi:hypothetical protein